MASPFRFVPTLGVLTCITACGSEPRSGAPCPEPSGEFPPTHCAYIEGRLTAASGAPLAGAGLLVDEFVPTVGYAYASSAVATDAQGRFMMIVFRINEFQPLTVPDTAQVYVRLYPNVAAATQRAATDDSLSVLLRFAPMGAVVDTTEAELTLP